jgi:hypothetical protein
MSCFEAFVVEIKTRIAHDLLDLAHSYGVDHPRGGRVARHLDHFMQGLVRLWSLGQRAVFERHVGSQQYRDFRQAGRIHHTIAIDARETRWRRAQIVYAPELSQSATFFKSGSLYSCKPEPTFAADNTKATTAVS